MPGTRSQKTTTPKPGLFSFPLLQPAKREICQPKGNNKAGFPHLNIGHFGFQAEISVIRKQGVKGAPIRPVTWDWLKIEYAHFEP